MRITKIVDNKEIKVTPVRCCNDGYYHLSDNVNEFYYLTDDNFLIDNNGKKHWKVKDIGENETLLSAIESA